MPLLGQTSPSERLYLKSTLAMPEHDRAWVDVRKELVTGDIVDAEDMASDMQRGLFMLTRLIQDWNFTDAAGAKVPITVEAIKLLPVADFTQLTEYLQNNITLPDSGEETKKKEI